MKKHSLSCWQRNVKNLFPPFSFVLSFLCISFSYFGPSLVSPLLFLFPCVYYAIEQVNDGQPSIDLQECLCVYVCVRVCVREREIACVCKECVCVCVHKHVSACQPVFLNSRSAYRKKTQCTHTLTRRHAHTHTHTHTVLHTHTFGL